MANERGTVVKLRPAIWDLIEIADYIAHDSIQAADRFLAAAEKTFEQLARMPGIGEPFGAGDPRLAHVRRFRVAHFKRYLIYYRPVEGGIEVLRVIHGARNIQDLS